MGEAEKNFKASKVFTPKGFIPITLFAEHCTVVMTILVHNTHSVPKEIFETLEELEQNKHHLNSKAGEVIFASQFVRTIQIQMNDYARSVERERRFKYPTLNTVVSAVLTDQFLPPPLPAKIEQQLFIRTLGGAAPANANSRGTPAGLPPDGGLRRAAPKHDHPRPHQPWLVTKRLKTFMEAVAQT